jgi:hypothetical protein
MSKFYCGDKDELPDGYEEFGSRYQCLRKGYGTAMYKYSEPAQTISTIRLSRTQIRKKSLDELKKLAKRHNISTTGTKQQILNRILQKVPKK